MGFWELTFLLRSLESHTSVNDVDLRVGVVILHAPPAWEMPMAAVVATSYTEILAFVYLLYNDGAYNLDRHGVALPYVSWRSVL